MVKHRYLAVSLAVLSSLVSAEPLVTDRPDATESSSVVGPGVVQLETGFTYADRGSIVSLDSLGTLVRIGVAEMWEARVVWDGYIYADSDSVGSSGGSGDAEVGFKYYIQPEQGVRPETALILHTSVPVGHSAFTSDAFDPSFLLSFSHTLSESSSLGYNIGASSETSINVAGKKSTLASLDYSLAYGFDVLRNVGGYLEVFGSKGMSATESPTSIDGGFTYLLNDDTQLDFFGGAGLNNDAPDWFAGFGISRRWR